MTKWFNTAGPCQSDIHYMLSATERIPQLKQLIEQRNYFVIHAPRQTGKTTAMLNLAQELTASGKYTAVMVSVEVGSAFNDQPQIAEESIFDSLARCHRILATSRITTDLFLPREIPKKNRFLF